MLMALTLLWWLQLFSFSVSDKKAGEVSVKVSRVYNTTTKNISPVVYELAYPYASSILNTSLNLFITLLLKSLFQTFLQDK